METVQVAAGTSKTLEPSSGFTTSDIVMFVKTRRVKIDANGRPVNDASGNPVFEDVEHVVSIDDPPGATLPRVDLHVGVGPTRLFTYLYMGSSGNVGPFTTTVPVTVNGFEANGIPKLFAAVLDPVTGDPMTSPGPGHCFTAGSTRVNDATTGAMLPLFLFSGATSIVGTIGPDQTRGDKTPWKWIALVGVLALLCLIVIVVMRKRARP